MDNNQNGIPEGDFQNTQNYNNGYTTQQDYNYNAANQGAYYQNYGFYDNTQNNTQYANNAQMNNGNNLYDPNISGDVFQSVFVDDDETAVATLSNGVLVNFLSGEGLKNEQAILSTKRLYYNHKEGIINRISTKEIVDIKDVTGTKIQDNKMYSILVVAAIFFILALVFMRYSFWQWFAFSLIAVIVFLFTIKKWLLVEYAGGVIRLSVKKYGMNNVIAFQRAIYKVKEQNNQ